jgi:hypothetical protein
MRRSAAVCLVLLLLAGCSGSKTVKTTLAGKLTYKDAPVNNASLNLYPAAGGEAIIIPVDKEGNFRAADVPAGDYKVVVQGSPGSPGPDTKGMTKEQIDKMKDQIDKMKSDPTIPFPDKYKKKESTTLSVTVSKGMAEQTFAMTD